MAPTVKNIMSALAAMGIKATLSEKRTHCYFVYVGRNKAPFGGHSGENTLVGVASLKSACRRLGVDYAALRAQLDE